MYFLCVSNHHQDIQVYRYYRDLINFKQKGDPSMMLKCINPNEAKYLDPAAGVHIKFRLAGVSYFFCCKNAVLERLVIFRKAVI